MERVTEARTRAAASSGSPQTQALDENAFVGMLRSLLAVVENYPDLKASENFLKLQQELVNTEDRIQAARRFFNGNVRDYANKREMFPSSLVAAAFGFTPMDYFEVEPIVREAVKVIGLTD